MPDILDFMRQAIQEAELSLREGNCGFGAVIAKGRDIVAKSHDTEKTDRDPTAHAELTAIRKAASQLGRHLDGCMIVSTHEPCPMCATAIVWAGIETVAYGYAIREAIEQGRNRIALSCKEVFERAGKNIAIHEEVLRDQCSVLYDRKVREQVAKLRDADEAAICQMADEITAKRLAWSEANRPLMPSASQDVVGAAYELLMRKLGITPENAPIVSRGPKHVQFASRNFCPTLEACRILGLDTRMVCKHLTEMPTTAFLRQIHPKLRFSRNYDTLRPYGEVCEETISLDE
jgi:tRNA(adenine34) deaminase